MRHVIFLDKKIKRNEFETWKANDIAFWQKFVGVTPQYWIIDQDFTDYPVEPDYDGDARPTHSYMKILTDEVFQKYSKDGTDFVMLLVHDTNWKSSGKLFEQFKKQRGIKKEKGIWGLNQSNVYHNYHVQYCRWDKNPVNTFGIIYHERHHALDALIATELAINVKPILEVKSYDTGITHGGETPWKYIKHQENTNSLIKLAPYLQQAFKRRQDRHAEYIRGQKLTIIGLLQKLVYLYRQNLNKKDGVNN